MEFIRHNENLVYKVSDTKKYIMRIHRPRKGFSLNIFGTSGHTKDFLNSELIILEKLNRLTDIKLQVPVRNTCGNMVSVLSDGTLVTVLEWIDGDDLGKTDLNDEIVCPKCAKIPVTLVMGRIAHICWNKNRTS